MLTCIRARISPESCLLDYSSPIIGLPALTTSSTLQCAATKMGYNKCQTCTLSTYMLISVKKILSGRRHLNWGIANLALSCPARKHKRIAQMGQGKQQILAAPHAATVSGFFIDALFQAPLSPYKFDTRLQVRSHQLSHDIDMSYGCRNAVKHIGRHRKQRPHTVQMKASCCKQGLPTACM